MRLATKIGLGYGLIAGLMLVALIYMVGVARTLEGTVAGLARTQFDVIRLSLILQRDLLDARDFLQKAVVLADEDYRVELNNVLVAAASNVGRLRELEQSPVEQTEISILSQSWNAFLRLWSEAQQRMQDSGPSALSGDESEQLLEELQRVQSQLDRVIETSQRAISRQVSESRAAANRAVWVVQTTVVVAVAAMAAVAIVIIRSIRASIAELTAGAKQVAGGHFELKLDDTRGDELADLAGNFNVMAARLAVLDELKKDFLSQVSHDLKAPLASIEETTRLLGEGIPGPVNAEQARLLELTMRSSQRLRQMVSNVLDMTTIETGVMRYDFKEVDVPELLDTVVREYEGLAREKEIEVRLEKRPTAVLRGDPMRLLRLFGNLLSNAIEYSPRGGSVLIGVGVVDSPGDRPDGSLPASRAASLGSSRCCLVSFSDRGPGVPERDRQRIFEKFYQAGTTDAPSRRGSGLGLAIVHKITEAHGGAVWVEPVPGGGSRFQVAFPLEASDV